MTPPVTPAVARVEVRLPDGVDARLQLGSDLQAPLFAVYRDGTVVDVSDQATWTSLDPSVATVDATGTITPVKPGVATIRGTFEGQEVAFEVTILEPGITEVVLTGDPAMIKGAESTLTATATRRDGSTADVTTTVTWNTSDPAVATVDATGKVTAVGGGTATVTADITTLGAEEETVTVRGMLSVTVTDQPVTALAVTPATGSVRVGADTPLTATATLGDGTTIAVTSSADWTSENTAIATVATGRVTGVASGTASIIATFEGRTATASVTVVGVASLAIDYGTDDDRVQLGATLSPRLVATYDDGTTAEVTGTATWTSLDEDTATVDADGVITPRAPGTATITATLDGQQTAFGVTVLESGIDSLAVTGSSSIVVGTSSSLTATAARLDGSTGDDVSADVTWTSSDASVATVDATGKVTAVGAGTATVTATAQTVDVTDQPTTKTATRTITVVDKPVAAITVTPADQTVSVGDTQAYQALATFDDASTADVTTSVSWSTGDTTLATIDANGLLSAAADGTTTVQATLRGRSGTAAVTLQDDRMVKALRTGNPDLVTEDELLAEIPRALDDRVNLADDLIPDGTTVTWRMDRSSGYASRLGTTYQPLLKGTTFLDTAPNPPTPRTLAAVGYNPTDNTRTAYFAFNPFVVNSSGWKPIADPGMQAVVTSTVGWLSGQDADQTDPATVTGNIVLANLSDSRDAATLSFLRSTFPNATINGGAAGANDCDVAGSGVPSCFADADLIITGDPTGALSANTVAQVSAASAAGTPVLFFTEDGNVTTSSRLGTALGLSVGQNYFGYDVIDSSTKASQVPSRLIDDQFRTDVTLIAARLADPLKPSDYASCITANGGTLAGDDLTACAANAGASQSTKDYFAALDRLRATATSLNTGATNPFSASASDQNQTLRILTLLADKVRTGKTADARADETATAIDYPIDTRADGEATTRALFADWFTVTAWPGHHRAADLGTLYCDSVTLVAAGSCPQPSFPDQGNHDLTLTSTTLDQWTATGWTLVPGQSSTITVTNDPLIPVYVATFTPYPSGDAHTAEFGGDGVSRYARPQFAGTDWVLLQPGVSTKISSPYGGPLYVRMAGNATAGPVDVDLSATDVSTHPVVLDANSDAQIAAFAAQLSTSTASYVDLVGTGFQIHASVSALRESLGVDQDVESDRPVVYSNDAAGIRQLLVDYRESWFNRIYRMAGLKVPGVPLSESLPAEVRSVCTEFGWPCTDGSINSRDQIQHVSYDVFANCGALCSGNPITSAGQLKPLGFGEGHELGHNLQRDALNVWWADTADGTNLSAVNSWGNYAKRSGEVSNNIFPYYNQWTYFRQTLPDRTGVPASTYTKYHDPGSFTDTFAIAQSAYGGLTKDGKPVVYTSSCTVKASFPVGTPAKIMTADATWKGDGTYDDNGLRQSFYQQLPMVAEDLPLAGGGTLTDGRDLFTILYAGARTLSEYADNATEWNDHRASLGLSSYDYTDDAVYGTGKNVSTMIGNDFLLIQLSRITGYDWRPYFAQHGVLWTARADAQVTANAPSAGLKTLGKPNVALGKQTGPADLGSAVLVDATDPAALWPGSDDDADGTPETKVGFNPSQCANPVRSIGVTGSTVLAVGETGQLRAVAIRADGSTEDVSDRVSWSSSSPADATVSSTGLVTKITAERVDVTATLPDPLGARTSGAPVITTTKLPAWSAATPPSTGSKSLVNIGSTLKAAAPAGNTGSVALVQRSGTDAGTQITFERAGSLYRIRSVGNSQCYNAYSNATSDGSTIGLYGCGTGLNNYFALLTNPTGGLAVVNANSGKCLTAKDASTGEGASLVQITCGAPASQRWTVS